MNLSASSPNSLNRRHFLGATGSAFAALAASGCMARYQGEGQMAAAQTDGIYGPVVKDPSGILDLPEGFSYRIVSSLGDAMTDGKSYHFGRLTMQTELAGACFSPDGKTLFVNAYSPSKTFAIIGPWVA